MKKITIGTLALCFALGLAANDDIETTRIKNDNSFDEVLGYWNANEGMMQKRPGGEIKKAPNGRSGSCMQITNTDKSFSALYSRALIPADKNTDTFKLSVWVRGKGAFQIGFYAYAKDGKYVSSYMEPATVIDSGEWVKKDYTIPASKLNGDVGNVRIAIEVNPGAADLYFDDFSGVKETALPKK